MRRAIMAALLCALTCRAFDAAPLVQYCSAESIATIPPVADYAVWWDASDYSTITIGGGTVSNVSAWASKSGGVLASNVTAGRYPVYEPTIAGGKPAIRFDGGDNLFHSYGLTNGSRWSCFAVFRTFVSAASYTDVIYARQPVMLATTASGGAWGTYVSAAVTHGNVATNMTVAAIVLNAPNNVDLSANGSAVNRTNGTALWQFERQTIGSNSGTSEFFTGYVSEIILYPFALTEAQRKQVEQYLGAKWSIAVTP